MLTPPQATTTDDVPLSVGSGWLYIVGSHAEAE